MAFGERVASVYDDRAADMLGTRALDPPRRGTRSRNGHGSLRRVM